MEHQSGHRVVSSESPPTTHLSQEGVEGLRCQALGFMSVWTEHRWGLVPLSPWGWGRHRRYHCCAHVTDWETEVYLIRRVTTDSLSDLPMISLLLLRGVQIQIQGFLTLYPSPFIPPLDGMKGGIPSSCHIWTTFGLWPPGGTVVKNPPAKQEMQV